MGIPFFIILLFAVAWVVLILPKQRELKRHKALVASLEVGDEVMTGSGFYGTLTDVTDDRVRIQLAPDVEVTLARRAVVAKIPTAAGEGAGTDVGEVAGSAAAPAEPRDPADPIEHAGPASGSERTPDTTADPDRAQADEDVDQ